jgi:hypothetical protein
MAFSVDEIRRMLSHVEAWLANNNTANPSVIHPDFTYSRGDI